MKGDKQDPKKDDKKPEKKDGEPDFVFKGSMKPITYTFKWKSGETYAIDVRAKNFQPFVRLRQGNNVNPIMNMNSTSFNPTTSEHQVAFNYTPVNNDEFHVEIICNGGTPLGASSTYSLTVSTLKSVFNKSDQVTGTDPVYPHRFNCRYKAFTVELKAGKEYVIELQGSNTFNAWLYLEDAGGKLLQNNFGAGGGFPTKSRITFTPTQTANYKLVSVSLAQNQYGPFTMNVFEAVNSGPANPMNPPKK